MAKKEFFYRGKKLEELQTMSFKELAALFPAAARRKLRRGLTDQHKLFLEKIRKGEKNLKTHCRDMIILPEMIGLIIGIHNGKAFDQIEIQPEMIGHLLGEYALTRKKITHSSPGVGATRSSSNVSVK